MNFKTYVETQYREWTLQQTWNDATMQWDRVGIKGELKVVQGEMTYHQFIVAMDRLDKRPIMEDFLESLQPGKVWPWNTEGPRAASVPKAVPETATVPKPLSAVLPSAAAHQSLFDEVL